MNSCATLSALVTVPSEYELQPRSTFVYGEHAGSSAWLGMYATWKVTPLHVARSCHAQKLAFGALDVKTMYSPSASGVGNSLQTSAAMSATRGALRGGADISVVEPA